MKKFALLVAAISLSFTMTAQIAMGTDDVCINCDIPHESAVLHVQDSLRGVLLPLIPCGYRDSINNPALGLLIFDLCDSLFYYRRGIMGSRPKWVPLFTNVNHILNLIAGNTLDQAYDEGGAGAGRVIIADAGPIEIKGKNVNHALIIKDDEVAGVHAIDLMRIQYDGLATALRINHRFSSNGVLIMNDTFKQTQAKTNLTVAQNSSSYTSQKTLEGRAIHAISLNHENNKPSIESNQKGTGHGVLGISGLNNWEATKSGIMDSLPLSGVVGYSGTQGPPFKRVSSSTPINPIPGEGNPILKSRIGVSGISFQNHGILGLSTAPGNYEDDDPSKILAAVTGSDAFLDFVTITGNRQWSTFSVAGLSPNYGNGVIGIGAGHGVIGLSGYDELGLGTMAGIWGNTRVDSWDGTINGYPLGANLIANKLKVGVLGTSMDRVGVWGESFTRTGVVATAGAQFSHLQVPTIIPVGIYATTDNGIAGLFIEQADTSSEVSGRVVIELAKENDHSLNVKMDSSTEHHGLHIVNEGTGNAVNIEMDNNEQSIIAEKASAIRVDHLGANAPAVHIIHKGGDNGLYVKNRSSHAAIMADDSSHIGVIGKTIDGSIGVKGENINGEIGVQGIAGDNGEAGVEGILSNTDNQSAALHGQGGGHRDKSAALKLTSGVITVDGPSQQRTAGIIAFGWVLDSLQEWTCNIDTCYESGQMNVPYVGMEGLNTLKSGIACEPPCPHSHLIGLTATETETNDLIGSSSIVFLTPRKVEHSIVSGGLCEYASVSAHVEELMDGQMKIRATILIKPHEQLPPDINPAILCPSVLEVGYLIVNAL
jgi:hypothetical protein